MDNWDRDDAGMWEIRDEPRRHTTSRLMCWVAVERMMRTARQRGLPGDLSRWAEVRDAIYERIMERQLGPRGRRLHAARGRRHPRRRACC